jgi:hypothetical protein
MGQPQNQRLGIEDLRLCVGLNLCGESQRVVEVTANERSCDDAGGESSLQREPSFSRRRRVVAWIGVIAIAGGAIATSAPPPAVSKAEKCVSCGVLGQPCGGLESLAESSSDAVLSRK